MRNDLTQIPVADLLPHKAPMLLLSKALWADEETAVAECTVGDQCSLFLHKNGNNEEKIGGWLVLELMAQTVGVYAGNKGRNHNEPPKIGFLLGTRKLEVSRSSFSVGETLTIEVKCLMFGEDDLPSQFECRATVGDETVGTANLTVFQPKEVPSWIR